MIEFSQPIKEHLNPSDNLKKIQNQPNLGMQSFSLDGDAKIFYTYSVIIWNAVLPLLLFCCLNLLLRRRP